MNAIINQQTQAGPIYIVGNNNVVNANDSGLILHFLAVIEAQNAQISALLQKVAELTSSAPAKR